MDNLITIEGPGPLNPIAGIDWSRPVKTKGHTHGGGHPVRIIAIDHSLTKPVIGIIMDKGYLDKSVSTWHTNGQYNPQDTKSDCLDLENVPEVQP